jgi:(p)ppGpp synthase/HD superfamily hydrolase
VMTQRPEGSASTGLPFSVSGKEGEPDWTNTPLHGELEKLCERLEAASPGDAEAVELARAVYGDHALTADRLGFHDLKARMEDAALRLTEPKAFATLSERLYELRANLGDWAERQREVMLVALERRGIPCTGILHRVKHTAGVRAKMRGKDLDLDEVHDLFAFRIIVPTETDCYSALGVIHHLYEADVSRFKDYIAEPKENGYEALHTCVQSEGTPLFEVQIRSVAMDQHAERGNALHWQYKANQKVSHATPSIGARWNGWWNSSARARRCAQLQ